MLKLSQGWFMLQAKCGRKVEVTSALIRREILRDVWSTFTISRRQWLIRQNNFALDFACVLSMNWPSVQCCKWKLLWFDFEYLRITRKTSSSQVYEIKARCTCVCACLAFDCSNLWRTFKSHRMAQFGRTTAQNRSFILTYCACATFPDWTRRVGDLSNMPIYF